MPALSEYTNVYHTAVTILRRKGYQVWYEADVAMFCAEKDGWDFISESPCGLLGVVAIFEFHQPAEYRENWWRIADAPNHRKLPGIPKPFVPVWKKN